MRVSKKRIKKEYIIAKYPLRGLRTRKYEKQTAPFAVCFSSLSQRFRLSMQQGQEDSVRDVIKSDLMEVGVIAGDVIGPGTDEIVAQVQPRSRKVKGKRGRGDPADLHPCARIIIGVNVPPEEDHSGYPQV